MSDVVFGLQSSYCRCHSVDLSIDGKSACLRHVPTSHFGLLVLLPLYTFDLSARENDPEQDNEGLVYQESQIQGMRFRHPIDTKLELVASAPLIQWPIVADWDSQGRLLVLESAGIAGNAEEQTKSRPHRLVRLDDVDGDGDFDRRTVVAEQTWISGRRFGHRSSRAGINTSTNTRLDR